MIRNLNSIHYVYTKKMDLVDTRTLKFVLLHETHVQCLQGVIG